MNGHGAYVWSSFALTLAVLIWNVVSARRLHAQLHRRLVARTQSTTEES